MTTDPRETLEAQEEALEARARLARGFGGWYGAVTVLVVVAIVVLIVWFVV